MLFTRHDLWRIFRIVAVVTAVVLTLSPTSHRAVYAASFNPEINYQGKLADNTGAAVDDDGYNMRFRLYDVATSGSPLWTEVWCYSPDSGSTCNGTGTDQRVDVINGLFSVLLGDVTSLSAVDFNDELWLEVSIGATGTSPTWEDLSPRKKLASVPAAFQADQLDGVDSLQFLRSDEADTMNASSSSTLLTVDQDGSGDILNVIGGSTEYFTVLSSGNVGINNDTPGNQLSVGGDIGITTDSADLRFYQGSNYVGFQASSSLSGNQIWTLPTQDATTAGQALTSDAAGNLSWVTINSGASDYLSLSDTPATFTASAIPFTDTGGTALLHSSALTFTDTNDVLTVGTTRLHTYGTGNLFFGEGAGNFTLSGANYNIAIGLEAGDALTTGDNNVLIGRAAGGALTTGSSNTVIGYQAGLLLEDGTNNAFIGVSAGRNVTTGHYNVAIGTEAGRYATNGNHNTFIGYKAGRETSSGGVNGDDNTFIGAWAGTANTEGRFNTFIGKNAGSAILTDSSVTAIGYYAGSTASSTSSYSTFIGSGAMRYGTGGTYNTIIGNDAGNYTDAGENTFIGAGAGFGVTGLSTGDQNVFIGRNAGQLYETAQDNVFIGYAAGQNNADGDQNLFLGYQAGNTATGSSNIFLGYQAGYSEGGSNKLYIANSNTSNPLIYGEFDNELVIVNGNLRIQDSSNEIWFGHTSNLNHQAAIGYQRLANDGELYFKTTTNTNDPIERMRITDTGEVGIGTSTPATLLDVYGDISVGGSNNELRFYEGGNYIGFEAPALSADQIWVLPNADATTSGQVLTSDGAGNLSWTTPSGGGASSYTGLSDTPGTFTASAIPFANTGATALLHSTGLTFTDTNDILYVGSTAIWDDGGQGIYIGENAGNTSAGSGNVMIGSESGLQLSAGANNTTLGFETGTALGSGSNNVLLGYGTGSTLVSGNNNILIGYDIEAGATSSSNQLIIGDFLYGDLSSMQFSVGTSTLSHTLAVAGSFDVNSGAINYATTTNITSIERLNLGNIEFEENAGLVSWFDLSVTSAAATGTVMGYVAQIDSNELLKLYSEADGSGGVDTTRVVIGSASSAVLGSSNIPDGSLIIAGGALCVDDGSADNCDDSALTSGQIYAESTSVTAIDLAENFPTKDPSLEAAELVMLDPDNPVYVKTYDPADPKARLLGVVSTKPGVLLGGFGSERFQEDRKVPVALAGRVPIKVKLSETGPVEVGDRLTMSSVPGVATKAGAFSQTVGIALEPIEEGAGGIQEILVFVNLQNGGSEGAGGIAGLNDQLRAFGVQIGQEITRIARLIVGKLTVGTPQNPTGITIYDMNTRQPYCIKILNGQHVATPGACEEVDTTNFFLNTGGVESASSTDDGDIPTAASSTDSGSDGSDESSSGSSNPPIGTPSSTNDGMGSAPTSTDSGGEAASTTTTSGAPTPTTTNSGAGSAPTTTDSGSTPPTSDPVPDPDSVAPPVVTPTSTPTTTNA